MYHHSLPAPVLQLYLAPTSTGDWAAHSATFGKVPSKKQTMFGCKLHLLITLDEIILDSELALANATDLTFDCEPLTQYAGLAVIGGKGYISAQKAPELWKHNRIRLHTLLHRSQKRQLPPAVKRTINAVRPIIETVNSQLSNQLSSETNHAHTFWGSCTRLYTKLAAHTVLVEKHIRSGTNRGGRETTRP